MPGVAEAELSGVDGGRRGKSHALNDGESMGKDSYAQRRSVDGHCASYRPAIAPNSSVVLDRSVTLEGPPTTETANKKRANRCRFAPNSVLASAADYALARRASSAASWLVSSAGSLSPKRA